MKALTIIFSFKHLQYNNYLCKVCEYLFYFYYYLAENLAILYYSKSVIQFKKKEETNDKR